jgi:hypothetical protein
MGILKKKVLKMRNPSHGLRWFAVVLFNFKLFDCEHYLTKNIFFTAE